MNALMNEFVQLTKKPECFLRSDTKAADGLNYVTKGIFDIGVACLKDKNALPIQELIISEFDQEQIWQELELLNGLEWPALQKEVSRVSAAGPHQLRLSVHPATEAGSSADAHAADGSDLDEGSWDGDAVEDDDGGGLDHVESESDQDSDADLDAEGDSENSEDEGAGGVEDEPLPARPHTRGSTVDDQFFRLGELEQFLELQDQSEERRRARRPDSDAPDRAGIDLFTADAGQQERVQQDEDEEPAMFAEFFDPPEDAATAKKPAGSLSGTLEAKRDLLASDSEEGEDAVDILGSAKKKAAQHKSTLEVRQDRLKARIATLEEQNLSEKPWQQRGETSASGRHENALLEEYVDFEQTRRAPETTAEVTAQIERLILRRVKDQVWDDVERKVKPVRDPYEFKKKLLLDQEKSKLSLAEVYEQEYLKQKTEAEQKPEVDLGLAHDEVEDIPKEHTAIKTLMADLFAKLDTLTHFHYMPKQTSAEVKIISKLPSIAIEEVTPVGASNATLLAPEEIKDKRRSNLLAPEERTDTDKKRQRRSKKRRQAAHAKAREQRELEQAAEAPERRGAAASRRLAEAQVARAEKRGLVTRADEKGGKKALKSSTAFFSQLQDQVTAQVSGAPLAKKSKKAKATSADVARMRL